MYLCNIGLIVRVILVLELIYKSLEGLFCGSLFVMGFVLDTLDNDNVELIVSGENVMNEYIIGPLMLL